MHFCHNFSQSCKMIISRLFVISLMFSGISLTLESSVLVRNKRYVAFPEGASLSVALCMTLNSFVNTPTDVTEGVNWGVAYDLPNSTSVTDYKHKHKIIHVLQRSIRRNIYEKIELLLDSMGFNGHSCILRALCETEKLSISGKNIIEELLEILFKFPLERIKRYEPEIHRFYHRARTMGRAQQNCEDLFPECQFSLREIILYHA